MKSMKYIFTSAFVMLFALGCDNDYIDPISSVAPGDDVEAPLVTINYPSAGALIRVKEDVAPITFNFEVKDDIEIESVTATLDGQEITSFSEFKDYRRTIASYTYNSLTNGLHTLIITAKDLSGKTTTKSVDFEKIAPYQPVYEEEGEMFYMPFNGDYMELVSIKDATKVGSPTFSDNSVAGKSYAGASGAYLTFPTEGLLTTEFSAALWYKVNASPDRSGILVIGPPDPVLTATPNNRKNGFRLFREAAGAKQRIKLNVGNGTADSWFDGGDAADIDPATGDWVHIAFTIADDKCVVYINGAVVSQGSFTGVDWTGCNVLSIASGAPRFMEWNHLSDGSLYDELRLFDKALSQAEIQGIMND